MSWNFATRFFSSSVSVGIESIIRVQANGAIQFERTLKRSMSSAMPRDSPTMPSLAEITDQPGGRRHVHEAAGILLAEMRGAGPAHVEAAVQVHADHVRPVGP